MRAATSLAATALAATALAAAALLAGCATPGTVPPSIETIRYETTRCFGACPSYVVTVSADGRGTFEGRGDTAVIGTRAFTITPAQFAAFRARLRPERPNGEVLIEPGKPLCRSAATDQITIDVRWTGGHGDRVQLAGRAVTVWSGELHV